MNALNIRRATSADRRSLERLAALDSRPLGEGAYLVAEMDGELIAAVPVDGGAAIADPFRRTAGVVAMLELHAQDVPASAFERAGLLRRAVRPLSRAAAQA